jgi:Zinc finger, C2H2 type/C2H2-type zinc finger
MSDNCSVCGDPFGSPRALVEHTRSAHRNPDLGASLELNPESHSAGLVCALCGKRFPSPEALTAHNLSRPDRRRAEQRRHLGAPSA